ncbi:hypothetical protein ACJRO7_015458 [Eucalyptus globulus]
MVECTLKSDEKKKKKILPIFFDVDPEDVKLKTRSYRKAIPKHKKKFGSDALKQWEDALVEVAHLKGWEVKGKGYGERIESVVGEVLCRLNARNVDVPECWVEDNRQIQRILETLEVDSDGVRFLGIHGVGGIGKTVLAKVVFNEVSSLFEGICFLNDVRESSQHGLLNVQKKLLRSFVGPVIAENIKDIGEGMNLIKKVCCTKKVLIVLDDLDKQEQLEKLAGKSDWFGSRSRIIFTTRNLKILYTQVESSSEEVPNQPKSILDYEVHNMQFSQALELFYKHAFRRDSPLDGYGHLSEKIVHRVAMLPLAVKVIGSYLYSHGHAVEQLFDKRKLWEETLEQLDEGPVEDVQRTLMISYEGLQKKEKEVFLDIACFFTNEDHTYPVIMWSECNYYAHSAIGVLLLQSLIKINDDKKFLMHDQVRDFGRDIIRKEYPLRFSRVWNYETAVQLLERTETKKDVEALSLTSNGCSRNIVPKELAALPNLRFLRVKGIDFFGNFKDLVLKLCWLSWEVPHNKFCAENFHFVSLAVLDLSRSNIEDDWDGWRQFQMTKNLKVLDLTGCTKLTRTPDFSNFVSLKVLILSALITIDDSISKLDKLEELRLMSYMPGKLDKLEELRFMSDNVVRASCRTMSDDMLSKLEELRVMFMSFEDILRVFGGGSVVHSVTP